MDNELEKIKNELENKKELEQVKQQPFRSVELKVSEKGVVQINNIRRFPITLYKKEIEIIFNMKSEIQTFIHENEKLLK